MLDIWALSRGEMSVGHLPQTGGSLDQAAIMMDAFEVLNLAEAKIKKDKSKTARERYAR